MDGEWGGIVGSSHLLGGMATCRTGQFRRKGDLAGPMKGRTERRSERFGRSLAIVLFTRIHPCGTLFGGSARKSIQGGGGRADW